MRKDTTLTTAERDALRGELHFDDARLDEAVAWATQAGYERGEVASAIFMAATEAGEARNGRKPKDAFRARIFASSPKNCARFDRFMRCAILSEASHHWTELAGRRKARTRREVAQECRAPGQAGFAGFGWATDPEGEPA